MIKPVICFEDSIGTIHKTEDEYYRAEIALILGRKPGSASSIITDGLISIIWEKRCELRDLLFQIDAPEVLEA